MAELLPGTQRRDEATLPEGLTGAVDSEGRRVGEWVVPLPGGDTRMVVPYVDGIITGTVRGELSDGTVAREEMWVNGRAHGPTRDYDVDGDLQVETTFIDGVPHGVMRIYHPTGELMSERPFFRGLPHGVAKAYAPDGSLMAQRQHDHGIPHGVWREVDGSEEEWAHGIRVRGRPHFADKEGERDSVPLARLIAAAVGLWFLATISPGLVATLLAVGLAIAIHEWGHLLAAHRMGIPIVQFRIGVGPLIARFVMRSTLVQIHAIPLFGWVRPALVRPSTFPQVATALRSGASSETRTDPRQPLEAASTLAPPGRRIVYEAGGVLANLLAAFVTRWLYASPSEPWTAAAWVGRQTARLIAGVPAAFANMIRPESFTEYQPGLLAAGDEHVTTVVHAVRMFVFINILLAGFNLLPLPPLDGFRILVSLGEKLRGKPLPEGALKPLWWVGMLLIGLLCIAGFWAMAQDIWHVVTR